MVSLDLSHLVLFPGFTAPCGACYAVAGIGLASGGRCQDEERSKMAVERENIESFLKVGTAGMYHANPGNPDAPRYRTVIRGWRNMRSIILDFPLDRDNAFAPVIPGQPCVIRFINDGRACAFQSVIAEKQTRSEQPNIRIRWPHKVEYTAFRQYERLKIALPAAITLPDGKEADASIRDISMGGCNLTTPLLCADNAQLLLDFELPGGCRIEGLSGRVRTISRTKQHFAYGIEFEKDQDFLENDIAFFVTAMMKNQRAGRDTANSWQPVLIIQADKASAMELKKAFLAAECHVVYADNPIDGLYRLRMLQPAAVILGELGVSTPFEISRMIRQIPALQELPVYIYGEKIKVSEAEISEAGVTCFFPSQDTLVHHILEDIGQLAGLEEKVMQSVDITEEAPSGDE
jgi:c-di-GMP-binding flagellar brake protein YcgR